MDTPRVDREEQLRAGQGKELSAIHDCAPCHLGQCLDRTGIVPRFPGAGYLEAETLPRSPFPQGSKAEEGGTWAVQR